MTEKEKQFCYEFSLSCDAEAAAVKCGYKPVTAGRLLKNDEIKAFLRTLKTHKDSSKIADHNEVLEFFTYVMRREDPEGIKLSDSLSAADKLHKYYLQVNAEKKDDSESGVIILAKSDLEEVI